MFGSSKNGFTIIELMVVIFLIGLITAIAIPNLKRLRPGYERKLFISQLNTITAAAWQRALRSNTLHKIFFDMRKRTITIEAEIPEKKGALPQVPLPASLSKQTVQWPENIEIRQFFINGKNDMARSDRKLTTIWFYIVPDGITQEVIINATDNKELRPDGSPIEFGLVLNPFIAQFKEYDSFQKP